MSLRCSLAILVLHVPFMMAHDVTEKGSPASKINNELETTNGRTESNVKQTVPPELECFDLYGAKKCKELRDEWKFCNNAKSNLMNEMCRKTCGFCKVNEDCSTSKYKCCEDGVTAKEDLQGSNCPGCKDKHSELCQKYAKDCNDLGWAGLWMQANCRTTCQYCKEKKPVCADDNAQKKFCPSWKKYGMCDIHGSLMKEHCAKTCGFCDLEESGAKEQGKQKPGGRIATTVDHFQP